MTNKTRFLELCTKELTEAQLLLLDRLDIYTKTELYDITLVRICDNIYQAVDTFTMDNLIDNIMADNGQ